MVDEFTILKSIHVLAAALWVGSGFALNVVMALAPRSGNPADMLGALRIAKVFGKYVFPPLSLITLVAGVWLTESFYEWDELWIQLGLIGLVIAIGVGIFYLGPKAAAGVEAIERKQAPPPGKRNWVPIVARLNLLLVMTIVVLMVIKPG
jgi:uncharacterized membrane protein